MNSAGLHSRLERKRLIEDFICRANGDTVSHPGGTLAEHLRRVGDMLERWGAGRTTVDAGRLHAAYGTDGFAEKLTGQKGRKELAEIVGEETEALISIYCRCNRRASYPSWRSDAPVVIDRESGETSSLSHADRSALIQITIANEIDVTYKDADLRERHGAELAALFADWRPWLSSAALSNLDDWNTFIGDPEENENAQRKAH